MTPTTRRRQITREGASFLKWVGGKSRYAQALVGFAPDYGGVYREPFLGSGAVFFQHAPMKAVLSDANAELVRAFQQIALQPEAVMGRLDSMENSKDYYLEVRAQDSETLSDLERAARLIYLNKTSFRGLWRVNRRGQMNTPYGAYDRPLYNRAEILACAEALRGVEIRECDFEEAVDNAGEGDFLYLDPPYVPLGGWADFKRYTPEQFNGEDHERLAMAMKRASDRGAFVLMTNSDTPLTREIFRDFNLDVMTTRRDINLVASARKSTDLLVANYNLRTLLF